MTSSKRSPGGGGGGGGRTRGTQLQLAPPDGGWGWMIVIGTASTNIFNQSMLSLFSLLYGDAIEMMGYNTQGAALVMSTMLFVTNFGGPLSGSFLKLTSPRTVAVTGACLCTVGIFFSAFSTHLWHLVLTYGVLLGTGLGLIQTSTFVSMNSYFKSKKGRAIGLAMAGTGLGQMLMPFMIRYLLENYGFTGCCCILGALSLHGIAGCLLLQPVEWHMKKNELNIDETKHLLSVDPKPELERKVSAPLSKEQVRFTAADRRATEPSILVIPPTRKHSKTGSYKELNFANIPSAAESLPVMNKSIEQVSEKQKLEITVPAEKKRGLLEKVSNLLDFRLLASPRFLNIIIGTALSVTSIQNFSLIFPFFLKHVASMDKFQVATCMSTVAGMDIVGRLTLPTLADKFKVKARVTLILTCIWLIVVRQFLAYQTTLIPLSVAAGLYGFGRSMIIVARNIAISEHCRPEQVPSAVGWGMMAMGIMVPPVGMFLGWLRDYTGSYLVCITAQNLLLIILLITWIPDMLIIHYQEKRTNKRDVET